MSEPVNCYGFNKPSKELKNLREVRGQSSPGDRHSKGAWGSKSETPSIKKPKDQNTNNPKKPNPRQHKNPHKNQIAHHPQNPKIPRPTIQIDQKTMPKKLNFQKAFKTKTNK